MNTHGLKSNNLHIPSFAELKRFDAVEVDPVMQVGDDIERTEEELIGSDPDAKYFWSVYLHCNPKHPANEGHGGVECVGDFPTKAQAATFGCWLEMALTWANNQTTEALEAQP
jgi:hypothetical protein